MYTKESLSHSKWECKYHVVFIPKCRRRVLYKQLRRHLGEVLRTLAEQKECRIEEGHLMPDHVHILISIPPKYAVSQVVGFIKGKSAIHLARVYGVGESLFLRKLVLGIQAQASGKNLTRPLLPSAPRPSCVTRPDPTRGRDFVPQ